MKKAIFTSIVLLCAVISQGQVQFSVTTERTSVSANEQIVIVASLISPKPLSGQSIPSVSPQDGFEVLRTDQNQSQSSSIQIINGRTSQKTEITYQFMYVITPKRLGSFTFPSLSVNIDGKTYTTESLNFTVGNEPVKNQDVRVSLVLQKSNLYAGEQTVLVFKVAQRNNSPVQLERGFQSAVDRLEKAFGKSFSLTRLFTNQLTRSNERIGGEIHAVYSLRYIVTALAAGDYNIPSVTFEYDELRRSQRRTRDPFFDDFFGGGVEAIPKTSASNSLSIRVKELPPPVPGFTGAVGNFTLSANVSATTVASGDAFTLKISVKGNNRPSAIGELTLPSLPECEIFTPEKTIKTDTTQSGFFTEKLYKYLIIPRQEGTLKIPQITFPYFDVSSGTYKTASSQELSIEVTRGKGGSKQQSTRYLTQEDIMEVGKDIRFIKTDAQIKNQTDKPYREPYFFLLYPIPFIIIIFSILYRFQSIHKEKNSNLYIRQKALRLAFKKFDHLAKDSSNKKSAEFLGKLCNIIEHYISEKFGFAATGQTLEELREELLKRSIDPIVADNLTSFIQNIDAFRFGGKQFDEQSKDTMIQKGKEFLQNLEKSTKRGTNQKVISQSVVLILLSIITCSFFKIDAAPTALWFESGNQFYSKQNYDSAAVYYNKIIDAGVANSTVYYNLGNTYFRLHKLGLSRLYLEKAAKLDPTNDDIQANIKFINSAIVDRVAEPPRGFLDAVLFHLHNFLPLRGQLWILFGFLMLSSILISAAIFIGGNARLWFIYISVLLGFIEFSLGLSIGIKIYQNENVHYAVVLSQSVDARNQPDGPKILFTAHEGTKFRIVKRDGTWSLVSLPNGISGWVDESSLGKI